MSNTDDQPRRPTEAQLTRLFAIAASKGYHAETVKHLIVWFYRYPTTSDLTLAQWAALCKLFETLPEQEKE